MTAGRASTKIGTLEEIGRRIGEERARGGRIALATGSFDVLHVGEVRYLQAARATADRLVVAVSDDESVRRREGPGRPWQPEEDRALLVAALRGVDHVIVLPESDLDRVLQTLRPDAWCRRAGAAPDTAAEGEAVRAYPGRVVLLDDPTAPDTRALVERLRG